jgi:hypothetical protein
MKVFPGSKAWMRMDRARRKRSRRARRLGITEFELLVRETLAASKPASTHVVQRKSFMKPTMSFDLRAGSATLSTFVYEDPLG